MLPKKITIPALGYIFFTQKLKDLFFQGKWLVCILPDAAFHTRSVECFSRNMLALFLFLFQYLPSFYSHVLTYIFVAQKLSVLQQLGHFSPFCVQLPFPLPREQQHFKHTLCEFFNTSAFPNSFPSSALASKPVHFMLQCSQAGQLAVEWARISEWLFLTMGLENADILKLCQELRCSCGFRERKKSCFQDRVML